MLEINQMKVRNLGGFRLNLMPLMGGVKLRDFTDMAYRVILRYASDVTIILFGSSAYNNKPKLCNKELKNSPIIA